LPEFLRHLSSKVDGFIFFNDRSEDETSDILKNTNAIEIKHSVQLLENGAFLSKVEAYKKGKVDPMVSKKVQEIIPLIFPDKKINFILPPPCPTDTALSSSAYHPPEANIETYEGTRKSSCTINKSHPYYNEKKVRQFLVLLAQHLGYKVALCCDADERFELNFLRNLKNISKEVIKNKVCYGFHFRELWGDFTHYRIDGVWGKKEKFILFPLVPGRYTFSKTMRHNIHTFWHPDQVNTLVCLPYNLYHLKMIHEENRKKRADQYKALDPFKLIQPIGYDYLTDTKNIKLESIEDERKFWLSM